MKKILLFTLLIFGVFDLGMEQTAAAQATKAQLTKAHNTQGKIEFQETPDPTWSKLFKESISTSEQKYFRPFEKYMAGILNVVIDVPVLKPPKGFRVEPDVMPNSTIQALYNSPVPPMEVYFPNYEFIIDSKTHQIKKQHTDWGSSIRVFLNYPKGLLIESSEFNDNCNSLRIPVFYYKPKMHKDNNGYWVAEASGILTEIRLIKKKGAPLYIPITQKEYLEYKKALAKKGVLSGKKSIKKYTYKIKHLKSASYRTYYKSIIKSNKQSIVRYQKAIGIFKQALSTWPKEKLNAPAYLSNYYLPGKNDQPIDLVSAKDKGAHELVRFNQAYFDKTLPKDIPQLILIGYQGGTRFNSPYMAKTVKAWFNQIDYAKLQAMLK